MAIFSVNRQAYDVEYRSDELLSDVLRGRLGLTGTKVSCALGECGACTVLMEGEPVLSCLTLAERAEGKEVLTIEGLAEDGELHPLQRAFIDHFGMQCGVCTPGFIMMGEGLLQQNPHPTEREVREAIVGNICRCGTYAGIVKSILAASEQNRASQPDLGT